MTQLTADDRLKLEAHALGESGAFPWDDVTNGGVSGGLTKRELFAAMVAQGLALVYAQGGDFMEGHVAEGAVKVADALLKELAK
jgi:hypothetical protein